MAASDESRRSSLQRPSTTRVRQVPRSLGAELLLIREVVLMSPEIGARSEVPAAQLSRAQKDRLRKKARAFHAGAKAVGHAREADVRRRPPPPPPREPPPEDPRPAHLPGDPQSCLDRLEHIYLEALHCPQLDDQPADPSLLHYLPLAVVLLRYVGIGMGAAAIEVPLVFQSGLAHGVPFSRALQLDPRGLGTEDRQRHVDGDYDVTEEENLQREMRTCWLRNWIDVSILKRCLKLLYNPVDKDLEQFSQNVNDVETWIDISTQHLEDEIAVECANEMSSVQLIRDVEAPGGPAVLALRAAAALSEGLTRFHELVDIESRSEVDLHFSGVLKDAGMVLNARASRISVKSQSP